MGCDQAKAKCEVEGSKTIKSTPVVYEGIGMLRVRIGQLNELKSKGKILPDSLNYARLTFCNQQFLTNVDYTNDHKIRPGQMEFQFAINQLEKQRCFRTEILSKSKSRGLIKLATAQQLFTEAFFNSHDGYSTKMQSFNLQLITDQDVIVGWLRVMVQFFPTKYNILNINVSSVTLRNQSISKRKVFVQMKIGGEIFQSESSIQSSDNIPTWSNAFHSFIVPENLLAGKLSVYEKNQDGCDYLLGQLKFNLKTILLDDNLQSYSEEITLKNKITGTVNLQFLKTYNKVLQLVNITSPKKIKYEEEIKIANNLQNQYLITTQGNAYKKNSTQPKTDYTSNRNSNSFCSSKLKQQKQKQKQTQLYSDRENENILNLAQSVPLVNLHKKKSNENPQNAKIHEKMKQNSNIHIQVFQMYQNRQFQQDIFSIDQQKLYIAETQSFLIQKKSQQFLDQIEQGLKGYREIKQGMTVSQRGCIRENIENQALFYEIQRDLQSLTSIMHRSSIIEIKIKTEDNLQFSLKEQSGQDQRQQRRFDMMEIGIIISDVQKRHQIKNIGMIF